MKYSLNKHEGLLKISGADAATFLQGQVTCDINTLQKNEVSLGALCNPKGRVICVFYVFKSDDDFYLLLSKDLTEGLLKRLKMFVFRSKVKISDISDEYQMIACDVQDGAALTSSKAHFSLTKGSPLSICLIAKDVALVEPVNDDASSWYALVNAAGLPMIRLATTELFIPQMLNLDLIGGISFTKGCYTGQEIVARLHYKGTAKRRLYLFNSEQPLAIGSELMVADNPNSLGNIVDCQQVAKDQYQGSLVFKIDAFNDQPLTLENGVLLHISTPPYPLSSED